MPHHGRNEMRQQAKTIRQIGETVWLRTSTRDYSSRAGVWDIVANDAPDPTEYTEMAIYAYVQWSADGVSYDETGHAHNLSAIVTANIQYMPYMQKCFAVRFSDGSILRKNDEALSDERTAYAIHVTGEANVVNF